MLPKSQRLNLSLEFKAVAQGKKTQTPSFNLMYRISDSPYAQTGVAISKQYFKKATERTKAKRLSYAAVAPLYNSLLKGLKLVIMPKQQVLDKKPDELKEELENVKDLFRPD